MPYEIVDINSPEVIQRVWEKGIVVDNYNPSLYRKDSAGAWIARNAYGDRDNVLGWEIDHVYPMAKGGLNHFVNLRPMNWRNNESKGEDFPGYIAAMVSDGNRNILKDTPKTVNATLKDELARLYNI